MRRKNCGISSRCWYTCAAVVFVLWVASAVVAKGDDSFNLREAVREFFAGKRIVPRIIVRTDDNPAPSVVLKVTSAPWCGPCRVIKPILDKLKKEGYSIKIETLDSPGTSVPYFRWERFGELEREHAGAPGYPDAKAVAENLRKTFAEIEGTIFQEGT